MGRSKPSDSGENEIVPDELQPFRAKARILSEIGDELISSDAIAIYELIKNAFDARSSFAKISVLTPMQDSTLTERIVSVRNLLKSKQKSVNLATVASLFGPLYEDKPDDSLELQQPIDAGDADALEQALCARFRKISEIRIVDEGHGMSRSALKDAFLAIGTPMRKRERQAAVDGRVVLGEKGVGRFSTKRLGKHLVVATRPEGSAQAHELIVDWRNYASDSEAFLDEVPNLLRSRQASDEDKFGTTLVISDLNAIWGRKKLETIAHDQLSKLMNPFSSTDFDIILRINSESVDLREFHRDVLRLARLHVKGTVDPEATPMLQYTVLSRNRSSKPSVPILDNEFPPKASLRKVGPFNFEIYEFNRSAQDIKRLGRSADVTAFINTWGGGGMMLFRDGFRIMPYGTLGHDWLGIDRSFFAKGKNLLRTHAMVGYVAITAARNPAMGDQTNREGLRENDEYETFKTTLVRIVELVNNELQMIANEQKVGDPKEAGRQLAATERQLAEAIAGLTNSLEKLGSEVQSRGASVLLGRAAQSAATIRKAGQEYEKIGGRLQKLLSLETDRYRNVLELAGLGMTAEQVSHELNSLLERCRAIIEELSKNLRAPRERTLLSQLTANLRSLRQQAGFLEPLTSASRRQRVEVDLTAELETAAHHYPDITEKRVDFSVSTLPTGARLRLRLNRGPLLQVLDNLLNNSLYWLKHAEVPRPAIRAIVDVAARTVTLEDNGPGVEPAVADYVFEPFFSTKPGGRGLGLYISRELLQQEDAKIEIVRSGDEDGPLRGFRITLPSEGREVAQ